MDAKENGMEGEAVLRDWTGNFTVKTILRILKSLIKSISS